MLTWRFLPLGALVAGALVLLSSALFSTRNASANPLDGLVSIAAGETHTCAITEAGGVKCWGGDAQGQLGSGLPTGIGAPIYPYAVDTADLGGRAIAIGAGYNHACAVVDDGSVRCWGYNRYGQLGAPVSSGTGGIVTVRNLAGYAVEVTAGINHSCALMEDGAVECWGSNEYGQLGNSQAVCGLYVACDGADGAVAGIDNATSIAAGQEHTCAVLSTGSVTCWGRNAFGQLGDGGAADHAVPVEVLNITDAIAVAAGSAHSCALTQSNGVLCWGNIYGNVPVAVPGLESGIAGIAAAQSHTCVLTTASGVKCWGDNGYGQLGDGKRCGGSCSAPVDVAGLQDGVAQIALGAFHTCALLTTDTAKCWGLNNNGQLGNGVSGIKLYSPAPVDVVISEVKPTPMPTPCAPDGCPTATPRPTPPQTGLDFSLSIDADDDGIADCGTAPGQPTECNMPPGTHFRAIVTLHALPPGLSSYEGFDTIIAFAGVTSERKSDITWPDCGFPVAHFKPDLLAFGCAAPIGGVTSSYVGPIGQSLFTCSASGSVTLRHGSGNTSIVNANFIALYEASSGGEQLVINCGDTPIAGDVDCSGLASSIDAQLMLQRNASLLDWLGCPQFADVNLDRRSNAVDSLLTLQYTAGLVAGLPILPQGR